MAARDLDNLDYQGPGDPGSAIGALLEQLAGGGAGGAYNVPGSDYGRETPGRGNPYDFGGSGAGSGGGGISAPSPAGGDRFSRGMEWLGQDIANNGSGRLDRAGQYQGWDQSPGRGMFDPADVAAIKGLFGGGGDPGNGNPKEPPGQGDPYASTMAMDPFNSMAGRGPQNNYAGPSVPLQGPGAPVSPFMSENNAFTALNAQNAAAAAQPPAAAAPPPPPMPAPLFPNVDSLGTAGGLRGSDIAAMLTGGRGALSAPPMPSMPPMPAAPPIPPGSPLANPQAQPYARYVDPTMPPGMPPLTYGGQTTGVTGLQGSSMLNRQVPGNIRSSPLASVLINEEPFFHNALIAPDDGTASPAWNQLVAAARQRPAPSAPFNRSRPRPRF
jgi:hypothetical protein